MDLNKAKDALKNATDKLEDMAKEAGKIMDKTIEKGKEYAHKAGETMDVAIDKGKEIATNLESKVEKTVENVESKLKNEKKGCSGNCK